MDMLDSGILIFLNEYHRQHCYELEKFQMLHGIKYQKEMPQEHQDRIRAKYKGKCCKAALELKTYYAENGFLSNTIVLKLRPERPEQNYIPLIKVHSSLDGKDYEYNHHAIEVFKENGKYKVHDVLHRDDRVWLEDYLDELCVINQCGRERLCYDMGYLAPFHVYAPNMQELSDVMRYLDKKYCVGKPRLNLRHIPGGDSDGLILSDSIAMDFEEFGKAFGATREEVIQRWPVVHDWLMGARFNLLHMLCLVHIMRDPIMIGNLSNMLFDDAIMIEMVEMYSKGADKRY